MGDDAAGVRFNRLGNALGAGQNESSILRRAACMSDSALETPCLVYVSIRVGNGC